jgi:ubiquinone/menaquinone biosynthesis C-methylase UbiE
MADRPRDLYDRLDETDEPTLQSLAGILELRGRHQQQVAIREAYVGLLGDLAGQRVLDVGCGTGVVARDVARRVGPRGSVLGVDPTPAFVEAAEELRRDAGLTNVAFQVGDGRRLGLPSADFDAVLAVTVLCHLPDREQVIGEMRRVARFGGKILIVDGDYAANHVEHPDRALTRRIIDAWLATVVDDPYLCRRLVPLIEASRLRVERVSGYVHVEAGRVDEQTSFIWQWSLFALRQALGVGAISESEGADWLEGLRRQNEAGGTFGSVTYVSALARRP